MQFILIATAVMGLVQAGVGLAEKLLSGKGNGAVKKEAVLDGVASAINTGVSSGVLRGDFKTLDPVALRGLTSMFIDMAVTISNKLGWTGYTLESPDTTQDPALKTLANQP
jgi:hypothetical protein